MKSLDQVSIGLRDNEDVRAMFNGTKPGERSRLVIEVSTMELTGDRFVAAVEGVESFSEVGSDFEEVEVDVDPSPSANVDNEAPDPYATTGRR